MSTYRIAHLNHQGHNVVLVELEESFHYRSVQEKESALGYLQRATAGAGLAGEVALAWQGPDGRAQFFAVEKWHRFCESIDLNFIRRNVNKQLHCT
jgi:hypothetical protein